MANLSMRRLSLNALLLVIILGLAALVWWQNQAKEQQEQNKRLLALNLADVNSIVIDRPANADAITQIELKRSGEEWSISKPQVIAANPIKVRQLLTLLEEKVATQYPSAGKNLTQYGLEPAVIAVSFNGQKLVLGDMNPVSNNRYILNGSNIQLVNETIYGVLQETWLSFASLKLVPESFKLTAVELPSDFLKAPELLTNWQNAEAVRLEALDPQQIPANTQKVLLKSATESKELVILSLQDEIILADVAKQLRYILPIAQAKELFPAKTGLESGS